MSGIALQLGSAHEARAEEAIILSVCSALQMRQNICNVSLVVTMQHNHIVKVVLHGVFECNLMGAAQTIVIVISEQRNRTHEETDSPRHPNE